MRRWAIVAVAIVAAIAIGATAYQVGVSHGIALQPLPTSAPGASGAPGAAQVVSPPAPYPYYAYHYYGPWRFGFFGPLLTIVLFVFLFRMLAWWGFGGWGWRRHYWPYDPELGPSRFDEWHRRAHERMREGGPTASPQT
jgi:hypothetical protein